MQFFFRFGILFGVPYVLINLAPLEPLLGFIASVEAEALNLTGFSTKVFGTLVVTETQLFQIVASCSGLVMMTLLFALLYSTPVFRPHRFALIFLPALFVFNLFRVYAVLSVGSAYPPWLEPLHAYLWFVDASLVLFLWFIAFASSPNIKQFKVAN